jgi:AcrR family transcriptional regulator
MSTATRKQQEIRKRELMLLGIARVMLVEDGFANLGLDRLAEATDYSKGTIYQHFSSKEDLVAALAVQSCETRLDLFTRAARYPGTSRERMLALVAADEIFAQRYPHYFQSEMIIRMANLDARASSERRERLEQLEQQILKIAFGLVREGIERKDLTLARPWTPEKVTFALFCQDIGAHMAVLNYSSVVGKMGITSTSPHLLDNLNLLLDGLQWKPLSNDFDYSATVVRVTDQILTEEGSAHD